MTLNYDLTHDLDPWFSRSNFEKVITQERYAWSIWNERDVSRMDVGPMLWLSTLTSPMTWTLNFQRQILKLLYPRNGRVDRLGTKRMWVDRMLFLLCDLELWLWPWILKVKFKKKLYHRNKRVDWHTRIWIHRMQCWKLSQKVVGPHGLNLKS